MCYNDLVGLRLNQYRHSTGNCAAAETITLDDEIIANMRSRVQRCRRLAARPHGSKNGQDPQFDGGRRRAWHQSDLSWAAGL